MSKIRLYGDTSGYVDLTAPAVADNSALSIGDIATSSDISTLESNISTIDSQKADTSSPTFSGVITFGPILYRFGKRTGTGQYTLFTNGSSSTQSAGDVIVRAIYGTPSGSGYWQYKISGNRTISTTLSNTTGYAGSTPSVTWSGADLIINNTDSSVFYSVELYLHDIGIGWNPTWGNFPWS